MKETRAINYGKKDFNTAREGWTVGGGRTELNERSSGYVLLEATRHKTVNSFFFAVRHITLRRLSSVQHITSQHAQHGVCRPITATQQVHAAPVCKRPQTTKTISAFMSSSI